MIAFQNSVASIAVNQPAGAVEIHWTQPPTSAEFREVLSKGLEAIQSNKLQRWVGDVRQLGAILEEDQKWSNEVWFPQAIQAGIKRMAVVIADDIFNQLSVEEIMNKVEAVDLTSHYFSNLEEARSWVAA